MYRRLPQAGELGWGQLRYLVGLIQSDLVHVAMDRLVVATHVIETTTRNLTTNEVAVNARTWTYNLSVVRAHTAVYVTIDSYAEATAAANYFGNRLPPAFYEKWLGVAFEGHYEKQKEKDNGHA